MQELEDQTGRALKGEPLAPEIFPPLAPCAYEDELESYFLLCAHLKPVPPPPDFPFD